MLFKVLIPYHAIVRAICDLDSWTDSTTRSACIAGAEQVTSKNLTLLAFMNLVRRHGRRDEHYCNERHPPCRSCINGVVKLAHHDPRSQSTRQITTTHKAKNAQRHPGPILEITTASTHCTKVCREKLGHDKSQPPYYPTCMICTDTDLPETFEDVLDISWKKSWGAVLRIANPSYQSKHPT